MSGDTEDLITILKLNEDTDDEALAEARALAMRYLLSRSPIPQTVLTVVERGCFSPSTESASEDSSTSSPEQDQEQDQTL